MQDEISLSRLDYAFSRFLAQKSDLEAKKAKQFRAIIAELSNAVSQGHSCIEINKEDQSLVVASGMADDSGKLPIVLENNKLYLQRYWSYECKLANKITTLITNERSINGVDKIIAQYFPVKDEVDWQKEAALRAINDTFTIITGGPGTGKTTTVVKILALLQELSVQPLNIALAAPPGKAAMRLQESIGQNIASLPGSQWIKNTIPVQVITLHRLLGARPPSPYFKYNKDNPLPYDIVVVDEVSMIDLPLMCKLVNALKKGTRLILLGDKDQLASVETGSVLADLTIALPEYTQELKKTYRFSGQIKTFADAVNQQRERDAWELLIQNHAQVLLLKKDLIEFIVNKQTVYLQLISDGAEFKHCFDAFNSFQVLCATRQGVNGVADINLRVTQQLKERKLIQSSRLWYSGRPVMVTQNDPVLRLYNGDIGICMPDAESDGKLMVFFLLPDGAIRKYMPARLSYCETVFAMTIHKSQGSEFNEVLLVLPKSMNPVLTKELIYTGVTRAKKFLKLVTNKVVFLETIQRRVERYSGLADRIKKKA